MEQDQIMPASKTCPCRIRKSFGERESQWGKILWGEKKRKRKRKRKVRDKGRKKKKKHKIGEKKCQSARAEVCSGGKSFIRRGTKPGGGDGARRQLDFAQQK